MEHKLLEALLVPMALFEPGALRNLAEVYKCRE